MKDASDALIALLNAAGGGAPLLEWDFYTFTLADGTQLRYGTAGFVIAAETSDIWNPPALDGSGTSLWFPGISWAPSQMGLAGEYGTVGHWKTGLDADSWDLLYTPRLFDPVSGEEFPDTVNNVPWLEAARAGAFDNADCIVSTAYYDEMPTGPLPLAGVSPVGTLVIARGTVGKVDCSDSSAFLNVTDYRALLNQQMPRNQYQSHCRHRLFDSRCGLARGSYTASCIAAPGSTRGEVEATAAPAAPAGSATYSLGLMTMTTGHNTGISRMITTWDGNTGFQLLAPFPFEVTAGDTFDVSAGCDKTLATCQAFGNEDNFGGEPYIPIPEVAIG